MELTIRRREMTWNSAKKFDLTAVQDVIGKPIYDLLLVINDNFSRICYRFRYIHA